jgi:membrane-bound lytic murein transglycosylase F
LIVKNIAGGNSPSFLRAALSVLALSVCQLVLHAALAAQSASGPESANGVPAAFSNAAGALEEHTFRVLVQSQRHVRSLPPAERAAHHYEVSLARRFADENLLVPVFIPVERSSDLIPALLERKGHIIAANLSVTDTRKARIAFTAPIETVREQLIVRTGDDIQSPADLAGREIVVREGSAFFNVVQEQRKRYPDIGVKLLPEQTDPKELLQGVLEGRYDMAAMDVTRFEQVAADWSHLKVVPGIFEDNAVAWGVRPDATELLKSLNRFIRREQLARRPRSVYKADFPEIKQRKVLRVLTRNNATTFFLYRGRLMGFEYELLRKFAEQQGLQLEMIVPYSRALLIPMLLWGGGDVVSASVAISDQQRRRGVEFTRPYNTVSQVVVTRKDDPGLIHVNQLKGRTIWVRKSSAYWSTLERLREKSGIKFFLSAVPEELENEDIINRVANGEYDLTVSDSHIVDVALVWRDDVRAAFKVKDRVEHGWVVRKQDRALLEAFNAFIEKEYRKLYYNVTYNKYFKNPLRIKTLIKHRADGPNGGKLSPYDDIVRKYAEKYGFDWPLIVAVMYRESRFTVKATSRDGAQGLMQMLPLTAKQFGAEDPTDPEKGIIASIKMLYWIYGRFEPDELPVKERTWFTLAAYNAGIGHVFDARELAEEKGWDPNRWSDNVEKAMLLLSERKYNQKATYGYVRGIEPVSYVRDVRRLYAAYVQLLRESIASN